MNTLFELTSPMTRVFDAAFSPSHTLSSHALPSGRSPRADVLEGAKAFQVIMDLPGVQTSDLEISLENQTLSVKAVRENEVPEGFERIRHERPAKIEFQRTFTLGNIIDESKIEAHFKDGVLRINLPKSDQTLPRRIEVQ
ncbi:hypothetical protein CSB20_07475 [bacterium DOLZORAL124_64_63]|nr:MAG: hypothetical protein CSB20_07475 [bacterium DOLZORAL124_64_63]